MADQQMHELEESFELSLDALVRSLGIRQQSPLSFFLGAGASISSNLPSAGMCIWEWKRQIFLTNNPGLETQFEELSLERVRKQIQEWLDKQGGYPKEGAAEEYSFYIQQCFPISDDRRRFFQQKIREATPHTGYQLLCLLAEADLTRSVWSTNFDGLSARAAANFKIIPIEVGIDTQRRLERTPSQGELFCVSMHGDYRYDPLKNTAPELQQQEAALKQAFIELAQDSSMIIMGYSGRDDSIMQMFKDAYAQKGTGILYWCGHSDKEAPEHIKDLIKHARAHNRQAFYIPTLGFDDLITRLSLHSLKSAQRSSAEAVIQKFLSPDKLSRAPFELPSLQSSTLIKSNAFSIECPAEVLQFDLLQWPETGKVWEYIRARNAEAQIVSVPFKGKIYALGNIDDIKQAYGTNVKGNIERTPISPTDLSYDSGQIVSLMCSSLTRSMAASKGLKSNERHELWQDKLIKKGIHNNTPFKAFASVQLYFRRIEDQQYLILKPSVKVLGEDGSETSKDVSNAVRLSILGYQHNGPFNEALNMWARIVLPDADTTYEYPINCGSTFRFKIKRRPIFGEIGLPQGSPPTKIVDSLKPFLKHHGMQLPEPDLLFSNKEGTISVKSPHPVRGLVENRPYDFPLTVKGFSSRLKIGIICPKTEEKNLSQYLPNINLTHNPTPKETDYLVDFPGFQNAYGLPIEIPTPGQSGWYTCPEPSTFESKTGSLEIAGYINRGIETLTSSYSPHVIIIFIPHRWQTLREYKTDSEHFDVHDFVKAFCVQRGIASQFLEQKTLEDAYQCRVWWWLSLALYVKGMRTPWVLNSLADNTAFVGLGFSIKHNAAKGDHIVLGCSHIYNNRGEGLQYRLSKIENPIIRQGNPFMSKDDARRTGEMIRQLYFDAHSKLPNRVVLHKRTPFNKDEREGLIEGLGGIEHIDMLEIQIDSALRYLASISKADGTIQEDGYPVRRGTVLKLDAHTALLWVHGATAALNPRYKYFQGKRRIPAPLIIRRHAGRTELQTLAEEILGLSKMNWNTLDLYTKFPATLQSSNEIAKIGSLLQRFGTASHDYRLFI